MIWYSQAGQDEWVHSIVGGTGFFVDVGAHDGIVHSNTYALEQVGWTGICFEPNQNACAELTANRTSLVLPYVVSNVGPLLPFDGVRVGSGSPVEAVVLEDILEEIAAPSVIDYLSIDVEGHEMPVLYGMDFDRWHVRLITIEHNLYCDGPDRKDAIYEYLTARGFERVCENVVAPGFGPFEDWYMHCGG